MGARRGVRGARAHARYALGAPRGGAGAYEKLTAITDPGGTRSEYGYDQKDQLIEVRRNGKVRDRYVYDKAGNVIEKRDGEGALLVRYDIDKGNLDAGWEPAFVDSMKLSHDEGGRIVKARSSAGHECTFAHDDEGLVLEDKRDGKGSLHHALLGRVYKTTVLEKFVTRYERQHPEAGVETLVVTDPTGKQHKLISRGPGIVERVLASGRVEVSQYDLEGRTLARALYHKGAPSTSWRRKFSYSGEGDLLAREDSQGGVVRYEHDAAHRLAKATRPDGVEERYEYDARGNIVSRTGADGSVTRYLRDALDLLVGVEGPGLSWSASYDALSRRVSKTVNGERWSY